jgi:hypothetical protein
MVRVVYGRGWIPSDLVVHTKLAIFTDAPHIGGKPEI